MKRLHIVTPYMQNIVSPNIKIIHKHIGGRTAKLPNDTYNRIHVSNIDTHIKHLYNNATANINRYTIYIKRNTQETLMSRSELQHSS